MSQTIIVTIDPCGRPTIDAKGFTGGTCKTATKPIEDVFSSAPTKVINKPELQQAPIKGAKITQR